MNMHQTDMWSNDLIVILENIKTSFIMYAFKTNKDQNLTGRKDKNNPALRFFNSYNDWHHFLQTRREQKKEKYFRL